MKHGFRGYVASRALHGNVVPQHIQNLVIRSFASQRNYAYKLSGTEYCMPECFMIFQNILSELKELEGVIVYSMFMMPESKKKRYQIYEKFLEEGTILYAAVENMSIKNVEDILRWESVFDIEKECNSIDYHRIQNELHRFLGHST